MKYPKILIISNNSLSTQKNNGKTIASFFNDYPKTQIAQLYFNLELPTVTNYKDFYQLTDNDLIKSGFSKKTIGREVLPISDDNLDSDSNNNNIKRNNFMRLGRELLWINNRWQSNNLIKWLDKISPEIIFFCAGDSLFAHSITEKIRKRYKCKLITYITDDYVLPKIKENIISKFRRKLIFKKMKKTIELTDSFYTISDKMRIEYENIFKKDSKILVNLSEPLQINLEKKEIDSESIQLIYAGGLHYNRYKILGLLGKAIEKINTQKENKVFLNIYTNSLPNEEVIDLLNIPNASKYLGSLNPEELKIELNRNDILVHVESFDEKSISATKLSVSTKIPEYLSLAKPILAIGPKEIASMEYLKNVALCINFENEIEILLKDLVSNRGKQRELANKAYELFLEKHQKEKISKDFINDIFKIHLN